MARKNSIIFITPLIAVIALIIIALAVIRQTKKENLIQDRQLITKSGVCPPVLS